VSHVGTDRETDGQTDGCHILRFLLDAASAITHRNSPAFLNAIFHLLNVYRGAGKIQHRPLSAMHLILTDYY